ncbi:NAD(P)H-hydrate dehydratase [Flavilitoribacter nigricans]|uniref:Bifunctional NAD(P)H-hydrate repair enzyme n=1 Tax=Flavilitoribacter nigricans (strain ATCC 23147 / DSM 23189 / NBRC 102662 / NCIMB 1420 / SS-2) TaxID=1122177 RepID=A0A2D0NBK0_FLAN2|nr:NAD(P)H-hydrate dehydratase [Flavilitoribacter nigricans]PHN05874.1 bifunctional ADP-dependent NAD(P)H-hydrate dehydratase/NAD(P)H-hydrate epimerase [Flavilitoribacter nigricans DSM 23189 = NBRC 102662]
MKILTAQQTRDADAYTIQHEPIPSIDLMERASTVFTDWFCEQFPMRHQMVHVFCGTGNNGGDGLAVARMLHARKYDLQLSICRFSETGSEDFRENLERLRSLRDIEIREIREDDPLPALEGTAIVIDAIFGSGLNRPVSGYWARLFEHINESGAAIASIDIPSGLFADEASKGAYIQADRTLTFELPKLAFLFPENQNAVGNWTHRSIGLAPDFLEKVETDNYYIDREMVAGLFRKREKFDHKGTFGHALLVAGSYGKVGAAILSARAALRSGLGLLTIHAPRCAYEILQISIPEAMVSIDRHRHYISEWPQLDSYDTVGIGPGIGQGQMTKEAILPLIESAEMPIVLDADGLNILSKNPDYFGKLPANSILTPHPKEFERLFGPTENNFERNQLQRDMAARYGIIIVLKGAHTCIALPDGNCYFNSTGNPGMATGGSGDVLTGILTGLLAQQYSAQSAAILGVYLHGLAGDMAVKKLESHALVSGDLIKFLGKAFLSLHADRT